MLAYGALTESQGLTQSTIGKLMQTVTGIVIHVERLGTTHYGNPMHRVTLSTPTEPFDGVSVFRVSNDASLNYEINNPTFRNEPHTFALTRAGRISHEL